MVVRSCILGALVDNGGNLDLENGQSEVIRLTGVVAWFRATRKNALLCNLEIYGCLKSNGIIKPLHLSPWRNCWMLETTRTKLHKKKTAFFEKPSGWSSPMWWPKKWPASQRSLSSLWAPWNVSAMKLSSWVSGRFSIEHVKFCVRYTR